jgi:hypothetical protein
MANSYTAGGKEGGGAANEYNQNNDKQIIIKIT